MRVGIAGQVLKGRYSGVERHILQLVTHLAAGGRDIEYVFYADRRSLDERDAEALEERGVRISYTGFDTRRRLMRIVWEQTCLPFVLSRDRIDLLHAPAYVAPLRTAVPVIVTIHDLIALTHPHFCRPGNRLHYRLVLPPVARRASRVITVSRSSKRDIIDLLGVPEERIAVVPNGVDPSFTRIDDASRLAAVRKAYGLPERFLLFVGNLEPKKNVARIIDAFGRLKAVSSIPHGLVIVGRRAWLYRGLLDRARSAGLGGDVVFPGAVPQRDLVALYNAAEVFVFPSLTEGFGMPPLEAMACGTPVVTSNVSSLPEVVGDAAITVDPRDVEALARAVHAVMSEEGLRRGLIRRGLERVKAFSWSAAAEQTAAVYRQVAATAPRRRIRGG